MTSSSPRRRPRPWLAALVAAGCVTGGPAARARVRSGGPLGRRACPRRTRSSPRSPRTRGPRARCSAGGGRAPSSPALAVRQLRQVKDAGYGCRDRLRDGRHGLRRRRGRARVRRRELARRRRGRPDRGQPARASGRPDPRWPVAGRRTWAGRRPATRPARSSSPVTRRSRPARRSTRRRRRRRVLTYADRTMENGVVITTTKVSRADVWSPLRRPSASRRAPPPTRSWT